MNLPNLSFAASTQNKTERFETAIQHLEDGLSQRHIWNVDYEDAKFALTRISEHAFDSSSEDYRNHIRGNRPSWEVNDPRWMVVYHPHFSNTPGAYKKLVKFRAVEGPDFDRFITMVGEVAQVADLMKSVKPFIEKGRKPSENPKVIDLSNTGICSVCGGRYKLTLDGKVVDHGFTLPRNWGGRSGICFGAKHTAWELSSEGAEAYKEYMEKILIETEELLHQLETGGVPSLSENVKIRLGFGKYKTEVREYHKENDPTNYNRVLTKSKASAAQTISNLTQDIAKFTKRIAGWKPQPLKHGGAETQERWKAKLLNKGTK
jgi:hypothetical protein